MVVWWWWCSVSFVSSKSTQPIEVVPGNALPLALSNSLYRYCVVFFHPLVTCFRPPYPRFATLHPSTRRSQFVPSAPSLESDSRCLILDRLARPSHHFDIRSSSLTRPRPPTTTSRSDCVPTRLAATGQHIPKHRLITLRTGPSWHTITIRVVSQPSRVHLPPACDPAINIPPRSPLRRFSMPFIPATPTLNHTHSSPGQVLW